MCSNWLFGWEAFLRPVMILRTTKLQYAILTQAWRQNIPVRDLGHGLLLLATELTIRREYKIGCLPEYIIGLRHFEATDPRDKIIALLDLPPTRDGLRHGIIPNYNKPVDEFYRDVTGDLTLRYESFIMLSAVEDRSLRKLHSLSSWVPDYSVTTHAMHDHWSTFNAAGSTPFLCRWEPGSNELRVHAYMVDEVDVVSELVLSVGCMVEDTVWS